MNKNKAVLNWSGGKDSAFTLYKVMQKSDYEITYLITTVSKEFGRIIQHGVREALLDLQSESIGIPVQKLYMPSNPDMESYNNLMRDTMKSLKEEEIKTLIFGDIFLEDIRKYREEKVSEVLMEAAFPIWNYSTKELLDEFINLGFKAVVVCVNQNYLDKSFAGREIDKSFINDLPENVDPCGENGEYHSFVYDGPIFKYPIKFNKGEIIKKTYTSSKTEESEKDKYEKVPEKVFWYSDLLPV